MFWKSLIIAALCVMAWAADAGPAWKGTLTLEQPDGTTIQARLAGDEFGHVMTDLSGNALIQNEDGFWCYAVYSPDGTVHSSGVIAGKGIRPASAGNIPYGILNRNASQLRRQAMDAMTRHDNATMPINRRCLILLADFPDMKMTHPAERFEGMINGSENSARRYFEDQFMGAASFTFDIAPIVTLSRTHDYYGKNNSKGKDAKAAEAVAEACCLAHENGIDFTPYDNDGDGTVDNIFIFVAGRDEAEGGGDNCIWSHAWSLSAAGIDLTLDGKKIGEYAITTEFSLRKNGKYMFRSIGTFCHEYSHTLGLMDMYDTDMESSGGKSECLWGSTSLMDTGNYNNEGKTPPYYNAIDRDMLGIGKPEELKEGHYVLEPIDHNGRFLKFNTSTEGEYYLIECRAVSGWDRYMGGNGLAIYHIDKSDSPAGYSPVYDREATARERWLSNEVNCRPKHQCADMIEAYVKATDVSQVFWPYGRNNSFSSQSNPAFKLWDGTYSPLAITDIMLEGDNVSFNAVRSESSSPAKVMSSRKDIFQSTAIIQWSTDIADSNAEALVSWGPSGKETFEEKVQPYSPGQYAIRLEGLKPSTAYSMHIHYETGGVKGKETAIAFTTRSLYSDGYPFIYLNSVQRNDDGTFPSGSMLPLVVFNLVNAQGSEWLMDGRSIIPGANGYYKLTRSCVISVRITYIDGATDIIEKEIELK